MATIRLAAVAGAAVGATVAAAFVGGTAVGGTAVGAAIGAGWPQAESSIENKITSEAIRIARCANDRGVFLDISCLLGNLKNGCTRQGSDESSVVFVRLEDIDHHLLFQARATCRSSF